MRHTLRHLRKKMSDIDKCRTVTIHNRVDNSLDASLASRIKPVKRLVKYEKVWMLDKRARYQHEPLLSGRQGGIASFRKMLKMKKRQPRHSFFCRGARYGAVVACRASQSLGDHIPDRALESKIQVHFGRHVAYAPLDIPDTLPRPALTVKKRDVIGIRLRVVGIDKAQ